MRNSAAVRHKHLATASSRSSSSNIITHWAWGMTRIGSGSNQTVDDVVVSSGIQFFVHHKNSHIFLRRKRERNDNNDKSCDRHFAYKEHRTSQQHSWIPSNEVCVCVFVLIGVCRKNTIQLLSDSVFYFSFVCRVFHSPVSHGSERRNIHISVARSLADAHNIFSLLVGIHTESKTVSQSLWFTMCIHLRVCVCIKRPLTLCP